MEKKIPIAYTKSKLCHILLPIIADLWLAIGSSIIISNSVHDCGLPVKDQQQRVDA